MGARPVRASYFASQYSGELGSFLTSALLEFKMNDPEEISVPFFLEMAGPFAPAVPRFVFYPVPSPLQVYMRPLEHRKGLQGWVEAQL